MTYARKLKTRYNLSNFMDILTDKNLANYVTMRIGGPANTVIAVHSEQDITEAAAYAKDQGLPIITLGSGTNIIFKDSGFNGVILINKIMGLTISESGKVIAGSGEQWDEVVKKSTAMNFCGIESLSSIPGTVGGAPVNNIGAYGQEIKDTLVNVRAFDTTTSQFIEIARDQCYFSYRDSRFKTKEHGRFIISQVTLQLKRTAQDYRTPNYQALLAELERLHISKPTPSDVRQAVMTIRKINLPDSVKLANTGSFFKNPYVAGGIANHLLQSFPDMPNYPQPDGSVKLAAGWLIDKTGLKNYRQNGMWIYDKQALVLINESAKSFNDLWQMAEHIIRTVYTKFGVTLEPEPEII